MALSMLNYFMWENDEARFPFLAADLIVIGVLTIVERNMKATKNVKEAEAKAAYNKQHEDDKHTKAAMKAAQREEQKRSRLQTKGSGKGSVAHVNRAVHQPDKTK